MICPGCDLPFDGLRTDDNFDMFCTPALEIYLGIWLSLVYVKFMPGKKME